MSRVPSSVGNYFIQYGKSRTRPIPFKLDMNVNEVNQHVKDWLKDKIPKEYHIEFYDCIRKQMCILNEDVLNCDYNFFSEHMHNEGESEHDVPGDLAFLVVDGIYRNSQVNMECDELNHDLVSVVCEDDASNALLNLFTSEEGLSKNNISSSDNEENPADDIFQNLYIPPSPIINEILNNAPSDNGSIPEDLENVQLNQLLLFKQSSTPVNSNENVVEFSNLSSMESTKLRFSHDVNRYQKDNYLSNVFPLNQQQDDKNNNNQNKTKGISFVQGVKNEQNKRVQVLPKIQGLKKFQHERNAELYICGVSEIINDGNRQLYLHEDKKFLLPDQLKPGAKPENPIKFDLTAIKLSNDGNFDLKIYMLTKWEKKEHKVLLHQLDEISTLQLHQGPHLDKLEKERMPPVRLLAVVCHAGIPDWTKICLSDFIHEPITSKKRTLSVSVPRPIETNENKKQKKNQ